MKKLFIFLLFAFLGLANSSIAQNWIWANSAGGISNDGGYSICRDNSGNVYVASSIIEPTAYFKTDTFTINGFNDFFLAKYDADGNEIWVKQFGGYNSIGNFEPNAIISYDPISQAIYMAGGFIGDCAFGLDTLHAAPYDRSVFLAKLNTNGNCLWAKGAIGADLVGWNGININNKGDIYTAGYLQFGTFDTITLSPGGFIAKYDSSGNCLLVKNIILGGSVYAQKIFNNDIFIFGATIDSTITVDTVQIDFHEVNYGKFLARFDSSYNLKWIKTMGGPKNNGGINFSMDDNGNCYIAGGFNKGYALFGNDTISSDTCDYYLTKYNQNGDFKWVCHGNASLGACASSVFSDATGNTYITGHFAGNADFGSYNINSSTSRDLFIARYDSSGNCLGVRNVGYAIGTAIISDGSSNAYITGNFKDTVNFGSTTLIGHGLAEDIFVAKIDAITGIGGLKTITPNNQLIIYANPNTGKCTINIPDEFLHEKNLTFSIFDNSGKMIQQKTLVMNDGKIKLDLEAEAKGIYNVTLTDGKKMYSGKIVFQ